MEEEDAGTVIVVDIGVESGQVWASHPFGELKLQGRNVRRRVGR